MSKLDKVESAKILEMHMSRIVVPELKEAMESAIDKLYGQAEEEWREKRDGKSLQEYLRFTKEEYERYKNKGGVDVAV